MISTKGIPEITCMEKDIRMLCPADRKDKTGAIRFTLWIYIADVQNPVATNYDTPEARAEDYGRIKDAWRNCSGEIGALSGKIKEAQSEVRELKTAQQSMKEAMEKTMRDLAGWRKLQEEEDRKLAQASRKVKTEAKGKAKAAKAFVPPTDEDLVRHILENGYDKVARQKPEGIARRFRRFYMRDGKTWRLANGKPMKDWKKAMSTWINNIDEDIEEQETAKETGRPVVMKPNAFTGFENQNQYDETLEEELLKLSEEEMGTWEEGNSPAAGSEHYLAEPAAG